MFSIYVTTLNVACISDVVKRKSKLFLQFVYSCCLHNYIQYYKTVYNNVEQQQLCFSHIPQYLHQLLMTMCWRICLHLLHTYIVLCRRVCYPYKNTSLNTTDFAKSHLHLQAYNAFWCGRFHGQQRHPPFIFFFPSKLERIWFDRVLDNVLSPNAI